MKAAILIALVFSFNAFAQVYFESMPKSTRNTKDANASIGSDSAKAAKSTENKRKNMEKKPKKSHAKAKSDNWAN